MDQKTFQALCDGDNDAWENFARAIRQRFRGMTVQAVGEMGADDVLQDVFVRVYAHRAQFRDAAHLERFVWRVWNQRVVDWHRRQERRRYRAVRLEPDEAWDSDRSGAVPDSAALPVQSDPTRDLLLRELRGQVEGSVLLTSEQKLILALHIFDELTFPEISRALQCNAQTVETRYYRALEALRLEWSLAAYRETPADFEAVLSGVQREALGHLLAGLPIKKAARRLGMRVPQLRELLAPALKILAETAAADWHAILNRRF